MWTLSTLTWLAWLPRPPLEPWLACKMLPLPPLAACEQAPAVQRKRPPPLLLPPHATPNEPCLVQLVAPAASLIRLKNRPTAVGRLRASQRIGG